MSAVKYFLFTTHQETSCRNSFVTCFRVNRISRTYPTGKMYAVIISLIAVMWTQGI